MHGSSRTATGDPPSGATGYSNITDVVKAFAKAGVLHLDTLTINVEYPAAASPVDPGNKPGSAVVVSVSYPYVPLTFIPLSLTLSSTSRGVIVF